MKEVKSFYFYTINKDYLKDAREEWPSALFSFWKDDSPRPHLIVFHPRPEIGLVAIPVSTQVTEKSIKRYPEVYINISRHLKRKNSYLCLMNMFPINKENCYSKYIVNEHRNIGIQKDINFIETSISNTHKYLTRVMHKDQKSIYLNFKYFKGKLDK